MGEVDDEIAAARAKAQQEIDDAREKQRIGKISKSLSAWEGLKQGATFGFGDELAGIAGAAGNAVGNATSGVDPAFHEGASGSYKAARDDARKADDDAKKANPKSHFGGEITGAIGAGLLAPAFKGASLGGQVAGRAAQIANKVLPAVASGAFQGGLQGIGGSRGTNLAGDALSGIGGAAIGGAAGALASGVAQAAGPSVRRLLEQYGKSADTKRVLTASGATGGSINAPPILNEAARVPGGVAEMSRVMRATGLGGVGTTTGLGERAAKVASQADEAIGDVIKGVDAAPVLAPVNRGASAGLLGLLGARGRDGATEAGVGDLLRKPVDIAAFAQRLEGAADDLAKRPEMQSVADAIRSRADAYRRAFPHGATMREAQTLKTDLGNKVNWTRAADGGALPGAQDAARVGARSMMDQMRATTARAQPEVSDAARALADRVFPGAKADAATAYDAARRASQVSHIVGDAAEESVGRADKRSFLSGKDPMLASFGASAGAALAGPGGGIAGAAVLPLAAKGLAPFSASLQATGAEGAAAAARYLARHPVLESGIGKGATSLLAAARVSPMALLREHNRLMGDPSYQAVLKAALDEEAAAR